MPWTQTREKDENSVGQETLHKNDGELSPFFPVSSSSRRFNPVRMAQAMPSIAANSLKQECWLFLTVKKHGRWKVPRMEARSERLWGLNTSVSAPVQPLELFSVGQFCQHVVAVCHQSSASLGSTALSSLHTRWGWRLISLFCWAVRCSNKNRYKSQTGLLIYNVRCYKTHHNGSPQGQKETMLMSCSSSSVEREIQLGRKHTTKQKIQ